MKLKIIITDPESLRQLEPPALTTYLRAKGWRVESQVGDKGEVWVRSLPNGKQAEVLVPLKKSLADYAHRISDVLIVLSAVEERSQVEIWQEVRALENSFAIGAARPESSPVG